MGNIGSHVDLTSGRRGHQAKPATAVAFRHTPARALGRQGPGISMFAGAKGISRQLSRDCSLYPPKCRSRPTFRLANREPNTAGANREQSAARSEPTSVKEPAARTGPGRPRGPGAPLNPLGWGVLWLSALLPASRGLRLLPGRHDRRHRQDHLMHRHHARLSRIDPESLQDGHQGLSELVERRLRCPDIKHHQIVFRAKRRMVRTSGPIARPGLLQ
jgi:hypothetical protein